MKDGMTDQPSIPSALDGASILVVDDEPGMRHFMSKVLAPKLRRVEQAAGPREASMKLDEAHFDLVILDNVMPGQTGLDWLAEQRRKGFFADVILVTAYADLETAIAALRAGVSDFLLKPFRVNQILGAVERALDRKRLRRDNRLLQHRLSALDGQGQLLGASAPMVQVRQMLQRLAPLPTPVLFTGQSGTGKELAARHLHAQSPRADQPFVAMNCGALDEASLARELFGWIDEDQVLHPGMLLLADQGTLFLDEVAQMPDAMQVALLRVLEDARVRPVGGEREIPLDVRFLFATNADLGAAMNAGKMRADLYHRINVVQVNLPPLADRAEDITELAALFMDRFATTLSMPALDLDGETLLNLHRYDWPGNVRELKNLIERSVILGAFPPEFAGGDPPVQGHQAIDDLEQVVQRHVMHVLDQSGGNRAEAARRLGVSRKTIDRKLVLWGRG